MSLDRQDVRAKLDHNLHAALVAICDAEGITIAEFTEKLLVSAVRDRVHVATVIAERVAGLGITGKSREDRG